MEIQKRKEGKYKLKRGGRGKSVSGGNIKQR
jgi:hypothetical protein